MHLLFSELLGGVLTDLTVMNTGLECTARRCEATSILEWSCNCSNLIDECAMRLKIPFQCFMQLLKIYQALHTLKSSAHEVGVSSSYQLAKHSLLCSESDCADLDKLRTLVVDLRVHSPRKASGSSTPSRSIEAPCLVPTSLDTCPVLCHGVARHQAGG